MFLINETSIKRKAKQFNFLSIILIDGCSICIVEMAKAIKKIFLLETHDAKKIKKIKLSITVAQTFLETLIILFFFKHKNNTPDNPLN